jgi:hypothetical protein
MSSFNRKNTYLHDDYHFTLKNADLNLHLFSDMSNIKKILLILLLFSGFKSSGVEKDTLLGEQFKRHYIEAFPIVTLFKIYSAHYLYALTPDDHLIAGFSYVNTYLKNREGIAVGQLYAPTIVIGYRRYFWKNLHAEYQLWPSYNDYLEISEGKFYSGFDLYSEIRAGYRIDLELAGMEMFTNPQMIYGFGIFPGNKPDSFYELVKEAPPFIVPSLSIGIRF